MAVTEQYLWPLFESLSSAWTYFGVTALLFFVSKLLWRAYILRSAEDPSSPLSKKLPLPPGDFGIPFIGETLSWALQGSKFNSWRRKKYGKVFSTHFLGIAMVKVTGAENVRQILQGEHDKVSVVWPKSLRAIIGESTISNSVGAIHKYKRKMTQKAFAQDALNSYIPYSRRVIARKINGWKTDCVQEIYADILQMIFESSSRSMVGLKFKTEKERTTAFKLFTDMVSNLFCLPYDLPLSGFRKALRRREAMIKILEPHLKNKVKRIASDSCDPDEKDVLWYIIAADMAEKAKRESKDSGIESEKSGGEEEERGYTFDELQQATIELMFTGVFTTASGVSSLIIQLAKHPEVRKMVEMELEEHGLREHESEEVDIQKLQKLTYLEQVVKETLRVMPPVLGGYRKALKTFQIGNYKIPKGWTVVYNIRDTHEYEFGEDTEFNPERFSREIWSEDRSNRFRWLPFGGGPRACIGKDFAKMIMKLTAIEMLKSFQSWEFEGNKTPPMFAVPILHPTNGLPLIFSPR